MSESLPGPGADLKAAREGLQVSIREVADALNLPGRVIEALEADDYDRLPPTVFTRGYLRSYARLLELPADELLARYPEVTEEMEIAGDTRTGTHAMVSRSRQLLPLAVAAVIVVLLLFWLLRDDGSQPTDPRPSARPSEPVTRPASASPEASGSESSPAGTPAAPTRQPVVTDRGEEVERGEESAPRAELAEVPTPAQAERATAAEVEPAMTSLTEAPAAQTAAPAGNPPLATDTAGSASERRITEFGDDRLLFRFSEDCWLEVKSLDGENLYSNLNRAGTTLELTGRAPFRVLLGYAPGVSLEFNGEPVALSRYARNNVASLVLGQ